LESSRKTQNPNKGLRELPDLLERIRKLTGKLRPPEKLETWKKAF